MFTQAHLESYPWFLNFENNKKLKKRKDFQISNPSRKNLGRAEKKSILIVSLVWAELGDLKADTNLLRAISAHSEILGWIYTTESFWLKLSELNLTFQSFLWDAHVSCTWVPSLARPWSVVSCQHWPSARSLSSRTISLCNISLQHFLGRVGNSQVMSCSSNKWVLGLPNPAASSQGSSAHSNSQRWAGDSHVTYWGITWNFNRPLTGLLWVPQLIQTRSLLQGLIPS